MKGDIWKIALPAGFFGAFNPFRETIRGDWFVPRGRVHHRASVYLDGHWLTEAASLRDVLQAAKPGKPLWFAEAGKDGQTLIHAQFPGKDPNRALAEVTARETVFYPRKPGINFITVRGFTLEQAAPDWAPPTAEQRGIIGTHWSKGWVIEDNTIRYSPCTGLTLGKYGDEHDNTSANTAGGYVKTIERALANGWHKNLIGHHTIRRNHIHHCEQAGIVGSLGAVFSRITDNRIHHIHVRRLFSGQEMAGIKFHAPVDCLIARNHIHHCYRGIWLDWMTQGTRVTRNLLHDNGPAPDIYFEVNHGPSLCDHNILLSKRSLQVNSQGAAYAHNLISGTIAIRGGKNIERRKTPWLKPHGTAIGGIVPNLSGDERWHNNILCGKASLRGYDKTRLPVMFSGNVFLNGATPSRHEKSPLVLPGHDPGLRFIVKEHLTCLKLALDPDWRKTPRQPVTTALLGKTRTPQLPYLLPDGSPVRLPRDYSGKDHSPKNPFPGPFSDPRTRIFEVANDKNRW